MEIAQKICLLFHNNPFPRICNDQNYGKDPGNNAGGGATIITNLQALLPCAETEATHRASVCKGKCPF